MLLYRQSSSCMGTPSPALRFSSWGTRWQGHSRRCHTRWRNSRRSRRKGHSRRSSGRSTRRQSHTGRSRPRRRDPFWGRSLWKACNQRLWYSDVEAVDSSVSKDWSKPPAGARFRLGLGNKPLPKGLHELVGSSGSNPPKFRRHYCSFKISENEAGKIHWQDQV